MSKHTPGPWTFYRQTSYDRGESFGVKAPAPHHWVIPALYIKPENARLIAAAPELLEMLCTALPFIEDAELDPAYKAGHVAAISEQIRALIAKATGES